MSSSASPPSAVTSGHPAPAAPASAGSWYGTLLAPQVRLLALGVVIASFFLPATGFGVDFCPVHRTTGLPCPGCGLTRAVSLVSQGDPLSALGANPFVVLVWPLLVALAVAALLPPRSVRALEATLERHDRLLTRLYRVILVAFLGFGAARFAVFLALWQSFP